MRRYAMLTAAAVTVGFTAFGLVGVAHASEQLSEKQFLRAANATCKKAYKAINASFEDQFSGLEKDEKPPSAQIETGVADLVEVLEGVVADVNALQGPAALERKVETYLDQLNAVLDEFAADPLAAFAEELSGYPFAKPDKLARKIGLKECIQRR